jgi:uncharacterized protein
MMKAPTSSAISQETWAALDAHVRATLEGRDSAHDYLHVVRVTKNIEMLVRAEGGNADIACAAALLHEQVNLPKQHPESWRSGDLAAIAAREALKKHGQSAAFADAVADAISDHAFSKGAAPRTQEALLLQDADRLDALGAIGIARCLATCQAMGRPFYDPDDPFAEHRELDDKSWGIDHFGKKLLLLADRMSTGTARQIAERRTEVLRRYLDDLRAELAP